MIELFLYGVDFISNINMFLVLIFLSLMLISFIYFMNFKIESYNPNEEDKKHFKNTIYKFVKWILIFALVSVFFPSEKTMYLMLGAHYLKKSDIPSKVELVINKKLDQYLLEKSK